MLPVGEIDLEMLSELHMKHPGVTVDNEVVEPSGQQMHNYKGTAENVAFYCILLLNAEKCFIAAFGLHTKSHFPAACGQLQMPQTFLLLKDVDVHVVKVQHLDDALVIKLYMYCIVWQNNQS